MKTWITPEVNELTIGATENGTSVCKHFDEVKYDESGIAWASGHSGPACENCLLGTSK